MPREITRIEVPDPEPMHQTPDGGAETQGAAYRLSAPAVATEPLAVTAPDGTTFRWVPTELVYRDETGQYDYIVGSAPATVQVRDREARYRRTFPMGDDVFHAEPERVKHWVILHEPPRAPAEYLSGRIEFGVTGLVSGVTLPEGRHDEIEAGPFRLPKPVVRDLAGREIEGYYEVMPTEGGQQLFVWFHADAILGAVYPVTIDPTVTTGGYQHATHFHNGITKAADGAYYALVRHTQTPQWRVYKSTDGGQTWSDIGIAPSLNYATGSARVGAICATNDGVVHVLALAFIDSTALYHARFVGGQWYSIVNKFEVPVVDIAVARGSGGTLHVARVDQVGTPSYAVYYNKWDGSGWGNDKLLFQHSNSIMTSIAANGQTVVVLAQHATAVIAFVSNDGGNSFSQYTVEGSAGSSSGYPHSFVDNAGRIWILYYISTGELRLRYWTGSGFSDPETVVASTVLQGPKGIAVGDHLLVAWHEPDGGYDQIKYRVRINGQWNNVSSLSPVSTHQRWVCVPEAGDTGGFPATWTEGATSPYVVRSETVQTNNPPTAPMLQALQGLDATEDAVFSWVFSDPDAGDLQSAYQLVIKRATDGAIVYDTGKVASPDQQHVVPGGTLQNGVQYRWTVRTWDSLDQVGPYATEEMFRTSAKPSATITDPATDGAVIGTTSYTIRWSMSDPESKGQSAYQVVLRDGGGNVVHDSGKVPSTTARAYTLHDLQNNTSYTVELTVWDGDGVASAVVTRTFQVQYTPPPTPDVTVEGLEAWVRITIANNNAGAEIQAVSNDVYRRKVGEAGDGIRIATNVPVDGVVYDYAVASGVAYEYRVVAVGTNGTTTASAWTPAPVLSLRGAWLHDPSDPAGTVRQYRVAAQPERGEDWETERALLQFAGRTYPVAEFGEHEDRVVRCTILVRPDQTDDLDALRALAARRSVICYRDSAGRRIFGILGPLRIRDERHGGYTVEIEIQAVDYDEAV